MTIFKQKINLEAVPKWVPIMILVFALAGFTDAVYLTVEHYNNIIPPCTIGGCEVVLSSQYSKILGIPVPLIGSVYYFLICVFLLLHIDTKKEIFLRIPLIATALGLMGSAWFVYLMIFVIKAFCPYCAVSAATSIIIFALSCFVLSKSRCLSQKV